MSCTFKTLLPRPSKAELALEQDAFEKYCRADPAVIRQLFDPMSCPAEFLPLLAYALSVDVWNPKWPEQTKRAICNNSLEMHLHKGTLGGVEDALAALGVRAEIIEWWQMEPEGEPGTMSVTLWVQDNIIPDAPVIIGDELTRDVIAQLERSKRASIHYIFRLAVETDQNGVGIALTAQMATRQRVEAQHTVMETDAQPTALGIALTAQMATRQRVEAQHTAMETDAQPTALGIALTAQMATRLRIDAIV